MASMERNGGSIPFLARIRMSIDLSATACATDRLADVKSVKQAQPRREGRAKPVRHFTNHDHTATHAAVRGRAAALRVAVLGGGRHGARGEVM